MKTETVEFNVDNLKELLNQFKNVKYEEILNEESDDSYIRVSFSTKTTEKYGKVDIVLKAKDNRLLLLVLDVKNISDVENKFELFEKILTFNSREILYGSLGYEAKIDNITYTNSISIDGRQNLAKDELLDYLAYTIFVVNKIRKNITTNQWS
ncbi:hypothetical protein [Bacillus thuringiensis]|uniref:hypothetical protein n=1 Tax=Bacillus thuringiensis TaxID=1428 RepID=UPI00217585A6|nr:hypothetical protein [Bacillus thuringiensis]